MNTRYFFAAVILVLGVSAPVHASVLSASGQAVRNRPADRLDYLRVTTVQTDLNASLRGMADASAATGSLSAPLPALGRQMGYFSYDFDGSGDVGKNRDPGDVFGGAGGEGENWLPTSGQTGHDGTTGNRGNNKGNLRGGRKGGAHAAPEPSTWMLLGAGMAMLGAYAVIRRRQSSIG